MLPLIIVRPEPGASETAARAQTMGLETAVHPLFQIEAMGWRALPPEAFDALLLTSANAARHGGSALKHYAGLPVLAVGEATAAAACAVGLSPGDIGTSDGAAVARAAAKAGYRRLLHLCGLEHRPLVADGAEITPVPVYQARTLEPTRELLDALSRPAVLLAHSPRAAGQLAQIVVQKSGLHLVAISVATAEAAGNGWASMVTSTQPDDAAMLALAAGLCSR